MISYKQMINKVKEFQAQETNLIDSNYAFLQLVFPEIEAVELDELKECCEVVSAKKMEVTGFFCNFDENYISIFVSIFDYFADENSVIAGEAYKNAVDGCKDLVKMVDDKSYFTLNPSSLIYELCDFIANNKSMEIIFNIITNYVVPLSIINDGNYTKGFRQYGIRTYDSTAILDRMNARRGDEHLLDLVEKFGKSIPAVRISTSEDVDIYLTQFQGEWLAQLYKEDSVELLSANVRSYLKRTNKVNKEIINTVRETPHEFVAYNNGLSAISTKIRTKDTGSKDFVFIEQLDNFLIVNGGQTTATLYECKNDKLDLSQITVPAKLAVIKNLDSSEYLINNISIYSNAQSAIKKSDPPSNSRFYKAFEELSKNILAEKEMKSFHCFFERTNGQYATLKRMHPNKTDPFISMNPEKSKFTKLQLAQAIVSWEQMPDLVCNGQEKNFVYFNSVVNCIPLNTINEEYFMASYSLILLYRKLDQMIKKKKLPYKSNLVTYTLAFFSMKCDKQYDLLKIWKNQDIDAITETLLSEMIDDVYEVLIDSPDNYPDIRMWARKSECWERVKSITKSYVMEQSAFPWEFFPENTAKIFIDANFMNVQVWKDLEQWIISSGCKFNESQIRMVHGMPAIIYKNKFTKRQEEFAKSIFLLAAEKGFQFDIYI